MLPALRRPRCAAPYDVCPTRRESSPCAAANVVLTVHTAVLTAAYVLEDNLVSHCSGSIKIDVY